MIVDSPRRYAAAAALTTLLALGVSGCASDLDQAVAKGCDGLRTMSQSYLSGDRAAFDRGLDQGWSFGAAAELEDPQDQPREIVRIGLDAVKVFDLAAYEPAEQNNGKSVWRGKPLTPEEQAQITRAMGACDAR